MVVNVLFVGETICLFEGVPYFLSPTYIWDMVDELKLTRLFITAAVLEEMESKGYVPSTFFKYLWNPLSFRLDKNL